MNYAYRVACFLLVAGSFSFAQSTAKYIAASIPVRDGKSLAADLYVNDTTIAKPTILVQTPYNKNLYRIRWGTAQHAVTFPFDSSKYHYVIVDWRGFYGSTNAAVTGYDRGLDGYDIVEWIASQRWSNGKVGTHGGSALGAIQFQTMRQQPPHLVCAVPMIKDFKTKYGDFFYGGDYRKEHVETMEKLGFLQTTLITNNPIYTVFWRVAENATEYEDTFAVPMLMVSGWFDHYPDDILRAFDDVRKRSAPAVRNQHKLIFGPWTHGDIDMENIGELKFSNAVGVANAEVLRFFDYYLNGAKNGYPLNPVVKYYQLGADEWRTTDDWNSLAQKTGTFYLTEGSLLSLTPPTSTNANATITYDPRDPSPSHGAARFNPFDPKAVSGPLDIRQVVESRSDALIFTTPIFDRDFEITGASTLTLYVSSDRKDTDFSARLSVVYPDGRSMIMTDGIKRGRFREGVDKEVFMTPGEIYPITIELQNLALTIRKGFRLRIVVSSSDYPRFDINLNNGGAMYTAGDTLIATNKVYYDSAHPSRLTYKAREVLSNVPSERFSADGIQLHQNYPNPFRDRTTISWQVGDDRDVSVPSRMQMKVFDLFGRQVAKLFDAEVERGNFEVQFDGRADDGALLPNGIYVFRLTAESITRTGILQLQR